MRISVCMATYNGGKYLREQMDSILNQDLSAYPDAELEVVVSDDGSTDLMLVRKTSAMPWRKLPETLYSCQIKMTFGILGRLHDNCPSCSTMGEVFLHVPLIVDQLWTKCSPKKLMSLYVVLD